MVQIIQEENRKLKEKISYQENKMKQLSKDVEMEHVSKDIKETNTRSMKTIIRIITPPPKVRNYFFPLGLERFRMISCKDYYHSKWRITNNFKLDITPYHIYSH